MREPSQQPDGKLTANEGATQSRSENSHVIEQQLPPQHPREPQRDGSQLGRAAQQKPPLSQCPPPRPPKGIGPHGELRHSPSQGTGGGGSRLRSQQTRWWHEQSVTVSTMENMGALQLPAWSTHDAPKALHDGSEEHESAAQQRSL